MLGLGVNKLWTSGGQKDGYAVLGQKAPLVAAFEDEYYRSNGTQTTFSNLITHSRNGNATMVDSDGLIKWGPHNLARYSQEFEGAEWTTAASSVNDNQGVAPDGTTTAALFGPNVGTVNAYIAQPSVGLEGLPCTMALWVKSNGATWVRLTNKSAADNKAYFNLSTGTVGTVVGGSASITDVGDGWYFIKFDVTSWAVSAFTDYIFGITDADNTVTHTSDGTNKAYIWGAHTYRSNLGGMANNPDRGDSYVPTTTSAVYLPRRGHHVYNGYEWVDEGLLHESEARTNLNTYLEADTTNWVASGGGVITQLYENVLGAFAGVKVASNGTATNALKSPNLGSVTSGSTYCITLIWKPNTSNNCYVRADRTGVNSSYGYVTVDGSFTSVGTSVGTLSLFSHSEIASGIYSTSVLWVPNFTGATSFATGPYSTTVGEYITTYAGQLELGSTPSSLIPTSGSSVTRAAETLTIPSANLPWPTPQYIGGELVTNGTFDTDISGWSAIADVPPTWDAGRLSQVHKSVASGSYQSFNTTAGKVYKATGTLVSSTLFTSNFMLRVGNGTVPDAGLVDSEIISSNNTTVSVVFVATGTQSYVYLRGDNSATSVWDNISVREINPLSVSIQMDGRMTYADEGSAATGFFFKWLYDNNNLIQIRLDTDSGSGDVLFTQGIGGVYDSVELTSALSPDILAPYNIAGRHGSTFINGAVDGAALTANTTPTALPDLSSTDLSLGHTYMGTIKTFRIWDRDLTDTGIAEATEPSLEPSLSLSFDSTNSSFVDLGWSE